MTRLYASLAALGVIGAVIIGVWLRLSSLSHDRDAWKETAGQYLAAARGWEASYRADARLRGQERREALTAVNAIDLACDARVATARKSSAAIRAIVQKEPARDSLGCPVRELVAPDRLRDALGVAPR